MPITAKPSRAVYERLGDDVANAIVDWFNQVDATYRADLRELNDLNFARFDAKVGERFAEFSGYVERRFADLETKFARRLADLETKFERRLAELETKFERRLADFETKVEKRLADLETKFEMRFADLEVRLSRRIYLTSAATFVAEVGALALLLKLFLPH